MTPRASKESCQQPPWRAGANGAEWKMLHSDRSREGVLFRVVQQRPGQYDFFDEASYFGDVSLAMSSFVRHNPMPQRG